MYHSSDRHFDNTVLAILAFIELASADSAGFRLEYFSMAQEQKGAQVGYSFNKNVSAVASGRTCRPQRHHVLIKRNRAVSTGSGHDLDCNIIYQHLTYILPHFDKITNSLYIQPK